ncbi:phage recombination protein Bet [Rhizobium leguminosarum]|uniref:phage recombination protein Bet n=1 Tax=Rhizobium leguminosarum TaxID=384 RepID=UPI0004B7815B|nr:phage recombination protein Bet [Rhizobium leguminosarum]
MNTQTQTRQQSPQVDQREVSNNVPALAPSRLPISPSVAKEFEIGPTEWRVLVDQIFPAAKSVEAVMMALSYCRKRNLDIFKKPVHIVPMWSSAKKAMVETVWPGIAEIRTTASRTGEYAGIDEVEFGPFVERTFEGMVEQWEDRQKVTNKVTKLVRFPEWAKVTVYRMNRGARCAYTARVFWEEMYASAGKSELPNDMWAKRPRGQLDKCVEAAALRKAFPEELGNVYAAEEMEGRDLADGVTIEHEVAKPKPQAPRPPSANPSAPKPEAKQPVTIEHEPEEAQVEEPEEVEEVIGDTEFFEQLDDALAVVMDMETLEEVWTEFDPLSRFDGKPQGEVNQSIALAIRKRAEKRIGAAA